MAESVSKNRAGVQAELGPRSLALLRRLVAALEVVANDSEQLPDPGKASESNENAEES